MRGISFAWSLIIFLLVLWPSGSRAESAYPGRYLIVRESKAGYIDASGKIVIEPQSRMGWAFSEGLAAVKVDRKVGFIDAAGKLVIPAEFDEFRHFSEGLAAVRRGERWTFVNREGKVGSEWFDEVHSFSEGLASVRVGKQWGYVDRQLKTVIAPGLAGAWDFTEGLAPAKAAGKWGFIDKTGQFAIRPQYYWVDSFSEGLAWVEGGPGKEGFIDKTGNLVIARRFWDATPFSGGFSWVVVEAGGRFGLIDKTGKVVVKPQFDEALPFSEGLACVSREYKSGYVDTAGKMVVELKFDWARPFNGGLADVALEGGRQRGWIDRTGKYVWGPDAPRWGENGGSEPQRVMNPMHKSEIVGLTGTPAREVSLVGSPLRKRYPDNGGQVYSRNVWDMIVYQDRIYIGSGDFWANTGPVEIYSFKPGEKDFTLEYTAPDEMVSKFYIFDDRLVVPGNDPRESWDFGNLYIKERGEWRKVRTIPRGLHCFDMTCIQGTLLAQVGTDRTPTVLMSGNWGKTWTPVLHDALPECLFVLGGKARGINWDAGLCTLEDGVFHSEQIVPRSSKLAERIPMYLYFNRLYRLGDPHVFHEHVVGTGGSTFSISHGPCPLCVLPAGESEVAVAEAFKDEIVLDLCVQGDTLYALCVRPKGGKYENSIYSTADLRQFRCAVSFTTDTMARSFVPVGGEFYVGLGCERPEENGPPPSTSTGDILRVIPGN